MNKNLLYTALGLMGIMGTFAIGIVSAETTISEPYGHIDYKLNGNEPFEAKVITITDGTDTITILDRNLGAKKAGTGCEDPNWGDACALGDDTYGYHFQRGNNYGFDSMDDTIQTNAKSVTTDGVERSGSYSNSGYYGDTFIKSTRNPYGYDYWTDSVNNGPNHYDLWGGSLTESTDGVDADVFDDSYINGDDWKVNLETVTNRRGPCPENFHVPSAGELAKLVKMFGLDSEWNNYEDVSRAMHSQLKIPFAGYRSADNALVYGLGDGAYLWSSSPYSASYPYSRILYLDVDGTLNQNYFSRANGLSVRCFYDSYQPYAQTFTLSFMSGDMVLGTGEVVEDKVYIGDIPNVTETGYILEYRYLSGADATTGFDFENEAITGGMANEEGVVYFIAKWTPVEYAITFVDGSGTQTSVIYSGEYNSAVSTDYPNWTKDGYTISWDKPIPPTMPLNGDTITASRTENKKPSGGSSGGGGRSKTSNDSQISPDPSLSRGEEDSSLIKEGDREAVEDLDSNTPMDFSDKSSEGQEILSPSDSSFTKEQKDAYEYAKGKGITTMPTIQKADMDGKLTRIAMAKMLSYYAINVLGQKPDETRINKFNDITEKLDAQYDSGVTLAYQLGIMGINMPNNNFRPNDVVTRAEFATALSRMLYGTPDGNPYYSTHLAKLKAEGILKNDDYKMKELRGYVMIMLMRSAGK